MPKLADLKIRIFSDGADLPTIKAMYGMPWIKGFTTNPTLMRKAGVADYKAFAEDVLRAVPDRPVCFKVFADEFDDMEAQALEIHSWGPNVVVKIPVTNTRREFAGPLIQRLSESGVHLNITAVLTLEQVRAVAEHLAFPTPAMVSVFAGRIADTGTDPVPVMRQALNILKSVPNVELLWASPREVLNIVQANEIGCHIVTATTDILQKLSLLGKDHDDYSLETVEMFYRDAVMAGYTLPVPKRATVS